MEEKKSKWKIFKEAWHDPKKHAIICLILYAIFFLSIFVIYKITEITSSIKYEDNDKYQEESILEKYKKMDNYEYSYKINYNNIIYNIDGTIYNKYEKFILNNTKENFYIENNGLEFDNNYLELENKLNLNLENLKPYNIYNIINDIEPNETTEYKDGSKKEIYNLKLENIKGILKQNYSNLSDDVIITLYSENDKINKIEIDIDTSLLKENIVIEYKNIGNISDFSINS